MGVFNNVMLLRNAAGQISSLIFKPNKKIAVFKTREQDEAGEDGKDLIADVIFSYDHKSSVTIPENPVESGVLINDHRIIKPKTLKITVGNNNIVGVLDIVQEPDLGSLTQLGDNLLFGNHYNSKSRVALKYQDLISCQRNGEPFDIETPLGFYKNMVITEIESMQDSETISCFKGTITFQEFIYFENAQTTVNGILDAGMPKPSFVTSTQQAALGSSVTALA